MQVLIELINIGDAQSCNIVVTGKQRGKMWFFTDVGIQPCAPEMSFLEWFEYWLEIGSPNANGGKGESAKMGRYNGIS